MRSSCVHNVLTNWQYHRVHRLLILLRDGGEAKNCLAHDQVHDVEYREVDKKCVEWRPHFWPKDKMHSFEVSVVAFSILVTFVPKEDDDGDGVGRKPEYGDGGEKNALEDKLEIESITVNDVNIFTKGIVGGSTISHFSIMETGLHPKPRF